MSERWETVPVSRKVRKALWDWAEEAEGLMREEEDWVGWKARTLMAFARQFRQDVLADRRAEMRELDERSPMPGGFPE